MIRRRSWLLAVFAMFCCGWGGDQFTPLLSLYRRSASVWAPEYRRTGSVGSAADGHAVRHRAGGCGGLHLSCTAVILASSRDTCLLDRRVVNAVRSAMDRRTIAGMDNADVVARNRHYWEALAPRRPGEPVEFFSSGGSALNEHEWAAVGDMRGRRVLQLACSVGDEALSFAQRGADVVAVDLAPTHLAIGRAKAEALGLTVDFREQDMMALDPDLTGFDLIFISWGGICWVPDLNQWASDLAERLTSGGVLVISEHHPLWEVLTVTGEKTLTVSSDYFTATRDGYTDPTKAPQITREFAAPIKSRSYVWGLGALVSAVLSAGLTIRSLQEFPEADMYAGLGAQAAHIPATYLLTATR